MTDEEETELLTDEVNWTSAEFLAEAERELYETLEGLQSGDLIAASQSVRRAKSYIHEGWMKRSGRA